LNVPSRTVLVVVLSICKPKLAPMIDPEFEMYAPYLMGDSAVSVLVVELLTYKPKLVDCSSPLRSTYSRRSEGALGPIPTFPAPEIVILVE
jgi:hypothetical protein